jgi:hypothetical protein
LLLLVAKYLGGGDFSQYDISISCSTGGNTLYNQVYAIDLDNDSDIDLIYPCYGDGNVYWYENDGSQSFTEKIIGSVGSSSAFGVAARDLDNDNYIDVVITTRSDDTVKWFKNSGNQTFTLQDSFTRVDSTGVVLADFNNDGFIDIFVSSKDHPFLWYYLI